MANANVKKGESETSSKVQVFPGPVYITRRAEDVLRLQDVDAALQRHLRGDWGDLDDFDKKVNDVALESSNGLLSVYRDGNQKQFLIITLPDRSQTLILLPAES